MSKKECLAGQWADQGYEDGSKGRLTDLFASHTKACAKVGVVPDKEQYLEGYARGLPVYCEPENGYRQGNLNREYLGQCPVELETEFVRRYLDGLDQKLTKLDIEYERTRSTLEIDRITRASLLDPTAVPKKLRNSIEYGESRLTSITSERSEVRARMSQWRKIL